MPSHAPAKQGDAADDVEVYANGVAFDVVKGWLGRAGEDLEFDQWFGVEDVDADRPARQERLGLGALKNRNWAIFKTSAIKGDGLFEGLDWLVARLRDGK